MLETPQTQESPIVFISYAHESDAFRGSVKDLADWLGSHGCTVLTDHAYGYRPPTEGWQSWMRACIDQADVVLVVCTPKLKARYEKTESPDTGLGGTYEGAIVTQRIYDAQMRNAKFYPVLPDEGTVDHVPTTLKPWWNRHHFPSGNEGIRRMIFDESPETAGLGQSPHHQIASAESTQSTFGPHERVTIEKLQAAEAHFFFSALQTDFRKRFRDAAVPNSPAEMVQWFTSRGENEVQPLFHLVRRALQAEKQETSQESRVRAGEEAASLLYCISACRLVDIAVARENAQQNGGYVLFIPYSENILCAVIATALFGGSLHLKPPDPSDPLPIPKAEWVLDIHPSPNGDWATQSFECAAFAAVFRNSKELSDLCLDSKGLTPRQRARLAARIDDIKDQELSLALVVHGVTQSEAVSGFAGEFQLPVLLPSTEITSKLFGIDADRLIGEIQEFWDLVEGSKDTAP